jgi:hypothetical protein
MSNRGPTIGQLYDAWLHDDLALPADQDKRELLLAVFELIETMQIGIRRGGYRLDGTECYSVKGFLEDSILPDFVQPGQPPLSYAKKAEDV